MMPNLLLILLLSLQSAPQVFVEATGPQAWTISVKMTAPDPNRLTAVLAAESEKLCGQKGYHLGSYTFSADQLAPGQVRAEGQVDTLTFLQNVACGPAPQEAAVTTEPLPPLTEADTVTLNPELESVSKAFFASIDEARYAEAFAVIDPSMHGGQTLAQWTESQRRSGQEAGATTNRQIGRLTWYSNPPGVPPGYYGAVDYVASHERQDECGYLVWHRAAPGAPLRLTRHESARLPHDLDPETRAALRQQYCIIL